MKIEIFLDSLEKEQLTSEKSSLLLGRDGMPGGGGPAGPPGVTNNCEGGNCAVGCGVVTNKSCSNFVPGCQNGY